MEERISFHSTMFGVNEEQIYNVMFFIFSHTNISVISTVITVIKIYDLIQKINKDTDHQYKKLIDRERMKLFKQPF